MSRQAAPRRLVVVAPGPLTTVQDLGRFGHLAVGVGRAGAADVASHLLGARLLGNADGAASLEVTLGGLRLRAERDVLLCLTGAQAPAAVGGAPRPHAAPFVLHDGQELALAMPPRGLRTYVSVRGGIDAPLVLGSRSTDTMSGLGPPPLRAGDVLTVGGETDRFPHVEVAALRPPDDQRGSNGDETGVVTLAVLPGPRRDWFADPEDLAVRPWTVSIRSDRKGIRLEGTPLVRADAWLDAELPSEGMVRGAIQVPPNGQPVLFLNDHPVTGGYPVVGVVRTADVDRAAQLRPGQSVRLRWVS
ncbi:biotin-dependent carboxyltransferase family protein [Janibacter sp. G1551]|uniref:5-oxoprolinase subunit C family protein n=1 Tax=Janibacter sp. G1551 TaxID=3420440 RepID=UPI003D03B434